MVYSPQKKSGSLLKWLALVAVIAAGVHYGPRLLHGGSAGTDAQMQGQGVPVSVAKVISKQITTWSDFSGILEAVHSVEVRPRVGGQIMHVYFKDGAEVKKGQPLFTIDPRPYAAALISAKGAFTEAQSTFERAKKLIKSKAISRAEFEAAQSGCDRALGNFKAAEVNLEYTQISAPISGKISRAEITEGNLVDVGANAPLLASIVAVSPIYASFDVDEQTFLRSIQGVSAAKRKTIPVEVGLGNQQGGAMMKAVIHSFDNQIVPGSGTIRVRALLPNTDASLIPGLYARVRIGSPDVADTVLINPAAVSTDQDKKFVMAVGEGNKAEYRVVTLGGMSDGLQIITSGLKAGEKIIVNGLQRVRPGVPIMGTEVDMTSLAPLNPPAAPEAEKTSDQPAAN